MFLKYNLFALYWALTIALLTLFPAKHLPNLVTWDLLHFDKVIHIGMFGILTFLLIIGFKKQYRYMILRYNAIKAALGLSFAYGVIIEFIQFFVPNRGFQFGDILADAIGCFIAYIFFKLIYKH